MIGVNLSPAKTFVFLFRFGEYTSWYQDGEFVSQYGVETATLRPQGKTPSDDFYSVAKGSSVSMLRLEMNAYGAEAKLGIGCDNVRRLWKIKLNPTKRPGVSPTVLMCSDGGPSPWSSMCCHLEETSLREHFATTQEERDYILKLRNPDNPFIPPITEEVTFDKETGALGVTPIETPRTIFNFIKRTNRTSVDARPNINLEIEEASNQAVKALFSGDPRLNLKIPGSRVSMTQHLKSMIEALASNLQWEESEKEQIDEAIDKLKRRMKFDVDSVYNNIDSVEDLDSDR